MPGFGFNSLRWRLLLLVSLAMAPMVALTLVAGVRERAHAIEAARDNLQRLARLAAANEAGSLEGAQQILRDLSSVPAVLSKTGDCAPLMADILAKNSDFVNFGVIELNGDVSCSAVPTPELVNLADRAHFKRAILERRFIAGNYVFGRVISKHTINVTYPVMKGNAVVAVLFAAIDLSQLDKFIVDIKLPRNSLLWTIDDKGTVISRRPAPDDWLGKPIPAALRQLASLRPEPRALVDSDGIERIYAFARVGTPALTDYTIMIGVPQDEIVAAARSDQAFTVLGLAGTIVLALLAAWFGGDILIVRRIQMLADTANRIASGSLGTRTGLAHGREEISVLARSLDEMAATLQQKEIERDTAEALLVAADQRKDEFLAMLAHELRNPLAPISTGAHLLLRLNSDNALVARTANIIVRQVDHMTRLVDDLLDVSRVTRGLVRLEQQYLALDAVVGAAVEQLNPAFQKKNQQLTLDLPAAASGMLGDRQRMVQVVANLLNNASRYTPAEGHIRVLLRDHGATLDLVVEDDGIGMTPELSAHVFELFTQGERASDRSQGGLGLGLALVRTLVQLHGGSVKADSAGPGLGSAFTVTLPAVPAASVARTSGAASHDALAGAGAGLRCLVVDDNADVAHMLTLFLEANGHSVAVAHNGAEAILLARACAPQLCLLDIGLPDLDGITLVGMLRKLPETAGAVMVAISGYGRVEDRQRAQAAGFDHYFVKPVATGMLMQVLASCAAIEPLPGAACGS